MICIHFLFSSSLQILSMSMTDRTNMADVAGPKYACSKIEFKNCEEKFQRHVRAVSAYTLDDKQDLWCQVLQVSRFYRLLNVNSKRIFHN